MNRPVREYVLVFGEEAINGDDPLNRSMMVTTMQGGYHVIGGAQEFAYRHMAEHANIKWVNIICAYTGDHLWNTN
jgi:hypothetical protein